LGQERKESGNRVASRIFPAKGERERGYIGKRESFSSVREKTEHCALLRKGGKKNGQYFPKKKKVGLRGKRLCTCSQKRAERTRKGRGRNCQFQKRGGTGRERKKKTFAGKKIRNRGYGKNGLKKKKGGGGGGTRLRKGVLSTGARTWVAGREGVLVGSIACIFGGGNQ